MEKQEFRVEEIVPGLIVRHTSRRIGDLDPREACEYLVSGKISFSEFVDQMGDDYCELLDFMTEYDLHPGRPAEVIYCIERYASPAERGLIRDQLERIYRVNSRY